MNNIIGKSKAIGSVGIIGCGWLGSALAHELIGDRVDVLASRSNDATVDELNKSGIKTELLLLPAKQTTLNEHPIFLQENIVIAITPQFRAGRVDYADKVQQLISAASSSKHVQKIILLNSTAIYNGLVGKVDENTSLNLAADKVAILNEAEHILLSLNKKLNMKNVVLRLSGLVGPNRHPGKFILNGRMLKNPNARVNLIHQQDAVGLILSLLQDDNSSGIFNGVSSTQATKEEYYQAAARALNLPMPLFECSEVSTRADNKIVSGKKANQQLNYTFVYEDLLRWLEQTA